MDESLNQLQHSPNISLAYFHFGRCWISFCPHPTCWANILKRKMSILIKIRTFKRSIAYWNILFFWSVVSFVLQNGSSKVEKQSSKQRKTSKTARRNGQMMKPKIWLNYLKRNPGCGIILRTSLKRKRLKKELVHNWRKILIPLLLL